MAPQPQPPGAALSQGPRASSSETAAAAPARQHDEKAPQKKAGCQHMLVIEATAVGSEEAERPPACHSKGWCWAMVLPVILILGVVLPLAVTVSKQQQELHAAAGAPKAAGGIKSAAAAAAAAAAKLGAGAATTALPICAELVPKGPSPLGSPPPPLRLSGSQILAGGGKGAEVQLHGLTWFGFENNKTMVDGLDDGGTSWLASDFATVVHRLKLLGFNAVRLPFAFSDLDLPAKNYARPCSPDAPRGADIAAATVVPGALQGGSDADDSSRDDDQGVSISSGISSGVVSVPPLEEFIFQFPLAAEAGACNAYLPSGPSTLPRFLWVIQYLVSQGLYVMPDYHPHLKELQHLSDPDAFARRWQLLWQAITCLPNYASDLRGRLLLDLLNEPDEYGLSWAGGSSASASSSASSSRSSRATRAKRPARTAGSQPLGAYLLAAMDAIEAVSPGEALFAVEGGGQGALGTAWGDGFVADAPLARSLGVADASPFFRELLAKPYRSRVVLAPHYYGLTVTGNTASSHALWHLLSISWGRLQAGGFCHGSDCQRFPVVIGEVGSYLRHPMDLSQLRDLATFMQHAPPTDDQQYVHTRTSGWFWFAYNPNSFDTGGLVQDDWQTLVPHKISWLISNLGLSPWWLRPALTTDASAMEEPTEAASTTLFSATAA